MGFDSVTAISGQLTGADCRIGVVVSRFNHMITDRLLEGARDALARHGVKAAETTLVLVPGAFELPVAAARLARSGLFDAVVCLGAVIRGATPHFDLVASQCAAGLQRVQLDTGVPVIFGVLATDTIEQALERAGTKAGNKGFEAVVAAIEMSNLMRQLDGLGAATAASC
jgi:6,7-dimethyl-8-ribityllumazine synthase